MEHLFQKQCEALMKTMLLCKKGSQPMKHLFIRQCKALTTTMLFCKKEQQTRELVMGEWVESHQCGYAACVLGHHATMNDVSPFTTNDSIFLYRKADWFARQFARQLLKACREVFNTNYLALSIYEVYCEDRRAHARATNLFTDEEIETLNHLNKEEPNFNDVVEYLELVIHKTEQALEKSA